MHAMRVQVRVQENPASSDGKAFKLRPPLPHLPQTIKQNPVTQNSCLLEARIPSLQRQASILSENVISRHRLFHPCSQPDLLQ